MPVRESVLERQFAMMVKSRGGLSIKLPPTVAGIPDRLVLWPNGRSHLVELKTSIGALRAIQVHRHKQLLDMGHHVVVLRGEQEIIDWVDEITMPGKEDGHNPNCSPWCEDDHPPAPDE